MLEVLKAVVGLFFALFIFYGCLGGISYLVERGSDKPTRRD